jgi:hypothetical protein
MYWGVDAGADRTPSGGIANVQFILEGATFTVTSQSVDFFVDPNGATQSTYGFQCPLDVSAWLAQNPNGEAQMYVVVTASDVTMQQQVIGPYTFYARTTEFSQTKTVGIGGDFTSIKDGLTYCRTNPTQRVNLLLLNTANYRIDAQASDFVSAKWWTVISPAAGVAATMGDGTKAMTQCGYDGIEFRGFGIKWDIAQLGYNLSSAWRFSNGGANRLRLNCVDGPFCGAMNPAHGGSGSGAAALVNFAQQSSFWIGGNDPTTAWNVYFTECAAHDLPAYGLSFFKLRRNSTAINVSGSDNENGQCIHGGYSDQVGGYYSGLRTEQGAFDLTGPVGSAYEKTGVNGSTGAFNVYNVAAGSISHSFPISTGNEDMAALIAAINTWAGWTATPTTTTNQLGAAYLSRADLAPSAAIPKTNLVGTAHLTRIADIHADVIVHHTHLWENICGRFFENRSSVGTAFGSVNGDQPMRDAGFRNLSNQDISSTVGESTQPGYWGGARQHVVWQYVSNTNPSGNRFLSGSTSDAYCDVDHVASPITIAAPPLANQQLTSIAAPVLPSGSDGNSKAVSTNQALLYTNPTSNPPNFTPLTPLRLADLSYAGRYKADGTEQGV